VSETAGPSDHIVPPKHEPIFQRSNDFIVFNQFGVKLELDGDLPLPEYFAWLDRMTATIGDLVSGAQIAEKAYARTEPRLNTGIYYDTPARDLLRIGAVLRTTCNKITHAFCAFKEPEDSAGVRRDHRHVFGGVEKLAIQTDPTSAEARQAVASLLQRDDIEHPGIHLRTRYGIDPTTLTPCVRVAQLRCPFFVWLDKRDALRCVMDRAEVTDLRTQADREPKWFQELELPVYPRVSVEVAHDPRILQLIEHLALAAESGLGAVLTKANKYQRACETLSIAPAAP
jgi:hypothetical protein